MATYYWVDGAGTWSATGNTHFATTSGGTAGAFNPTTGDTVIFDSLSNIPGSGASYTCTRNTAITLASLSLANPSAGVLTLANGTSTLAISSGFTVASGVVYTGTGLIALNGTQTLTTNNVAFPNGFVVNGTGITVTLGSALTTTGAFTLIIGTLSLANYTLTARNFTSTNSNVRTINFGTGSFVLSGTTGVAWITSASTNLTFAGTGSISIIGTVAKFFSGGNMVFPCQIIQNGTGAITFAGNNTFSNITNTVTPTTVTFPAGSTTTFNNFNLNGTAGNLVTINSQTVGTQATLSNASGADVSCDYLSITDIAAI